MPLSDRDRLPRIKLTPDHKELIKLVNTSVNQIKQELNYNLNINEINQLTYATAYITTTRCGTPIKKTRGNKPSEPHWKKTIQSKINIIRGELATINESKKENQSKRVKEKCKKLRKKYKINSVPELLELEEKLKQKVAANA